MTEFRSDDDDQEWLRVNDCVRTQTLTVFTNGMAMHVSILGDGL